MELLPAHCPSFQSPSRFIPFHMHAGTLYSHVAVSVTVVPFVPPNVVSIWVVNSAVASALPSNGDPMADFTEAFTPAPAVTLSSTDRTTSTECVKKPCLTEFSL